MVIRIIFYIRSKLNKWHLPGMIYGLLLYMCIPTVWLLIDHIIYIHLPSIISFHLAYWLPLYDLTFLTYCQSAIHFPLITATFGLILYNLLFFV